MHVNLPAPPLSLACSNLPAATRVAAALVLSKSIKMNRPQTRVKPLCRMDEWMITQVFSYEIILSLSLQFWGNFAWAFTRCRQFLDTSNLTLGFDPIRCWLNIFHYRPWIDGDRPHPIRVIFIGRWAGEGLGHEELQVKCTPKVVRKVSSKEQRHTA